MDLRILSVNIGRARVIGTVHGEDVLSGIDKKAMVGDTAFVGALGINGDEQADLTVHGGVDKAVYAYPSENWPWWVTEKGIACRPATFGENLTLEGADENDVAIGDRFRWETPCSKSASRARPATSSACTPGVPMRRS